MNSKSTPIILTLIAIIITGILGIRLIIQLGVPQILVFISYVVLAAFILTVPLSVRRMRSGLILNIVLALIVMVATTSSSSHLSVIQNLNPLDGALILITGAYILQPILIILSVRAFRSS